jgi:hypothetical protein
LIPCIEFVASEFDALGTNEINQWKLYNILKYTLYNNADKDIKYKKAELVFYVQDYSDFKRNNRKYKFKRVVYADVIL